MFKSLLTAVMGVMVVSSANAAEGDTMKDAFFAGGCFWCIESDFEKLDGIGDVESGYINSKVTNPTYKTVSKGTTGAVEAIRIPYDPSVITYEELVKYFYKHVDPLDARGQFCDKGPQYVSAIYPLDASERAIAEAVTKQASEVLGQKIATTVDDFENYTRAEEYHQNYYIKNPLRYKYYRHSCGRNKRVDQVWSGKTL